jgi:hypothetical protein
MNENINHRRCENQECDMNHACVENHTENMNQ